MDEETRQRPVSMTTLYFSFVRVSMRIACALIAFFFMSSTVYAEIEKIAVPSEKGFSFYWWPKLAAVEGWHQDREHSILYSANALAPDGFTFKTAESVIYVSALYKPRSPEITSLDALIKNDKMDFEANVPGISVNEVAPLVTADGEKLRSFTFFPTKGGNWERVSYGEEGEFFLIFTVSSRSQSNFTSAVVAYEKFISAYKK
jgi:hypothetical protein